ncbi:hypothetical protein FOA43_003757 [Brettanomyces nanus]|uniref:Peroxisomal membrane protein 4 n=1 Tax=Eeniella nana TaxID=13502 RepID=A0A875S9S6_EENNA|nr:uncharacterized protein FOA43_003757 [Brettanomyces nanus]QPG76369.1 hypothetical protein FOA43_003757 [Brettanomyces nanus]
MDSIDKNSSEVLVGSALRAAKNALIYGYKIRFVHAIALQLLSVKKNQNYWKQFIEKVAKSVRMGLNHGKVLALFALLYKLLFGTLLTLSRETVKGRKSEEYWTKVKGSIGFISGFISGLLIYGGVLNEHFGKDVLNDRILTQITLYTLSRTILAMGKYLAVRIAGSGKGSRQVKKIEEVSWKVGTAAVWGTVMMFYSIDRKYYLQRAMRISMDFLYGETLYSWMDAFNYGH